MVRDEGKGRRIEHSILRAGRCSAVVAIASEIAIR